MIDDSFRGIRSQLTVPPTHKTEKQAGYLFYFLLLDVVGLTKDESVPQQSEEDIVVTEEQQRQRDDVIPVGMHC